MRRISRRLRHLFFRQRVQAEMAEEMRFHLEQRAADYAAGGLPDSEARAAARQRFGNLTGIEERAWDAHGWRWLERLATDLRLAGRQLVRAPAFALLAVVTLGLGIGVNTTMFNMLKTILLKELPYPDSAQLDRIYRALPQGGEGNFSTGDFLDLQRAADGYGQVSALLRANASLSEPGQPAEMAAAVRVSANFFSLLGVQPPLGRDFRAGEDRPGGDRIVILSDRTWRRRFAGSPEVIGRTIRVDGESHQIVGVLPESFNDWRHLGWVDLFRPLALDPGPSADRTPANIRLLGRRSATRSRAEADGFLAGFGARLAAEFPAAHAGSAWRTIPLERAINGKGNAAVLMMLIALSGFVLLIACSNLANFLLARTMGRARELAVRSALGASPLQLLRPLIAESLLLSLVGGAFALLVAHWAARWLALRSIGENGEGVAVTVDWPVFGWALGASLVTALAFAIAPALFALRLDLNDTLKSGGRGATAGRGHRRFRQALVIGQFALAMVLLAGAGLFIRGLHDLNNRRSGWESDQLITATYSLPAPRYAGAGELRALHQRALERLQSLPGVASASASAYNPFFNWSDARKFLVEGRERPVAGREPAALVNAVTPRYFETVGTTLLAGRVFSERDAQDTPRVFIINQTMARHLFEGKNPVGRRLVHIQQGSEPVGEIVGVVADVQSVLPDPNPVTFQVYLPMAQEPRREVELAVRSASALPSDLVGSVRAAMTELDPDLPLRRLGPAAATINYANYQLAVLRDILISFAVLGLGLACLGIYGVIARLVAQRTGELAIRLVLGATVADISRLVLASGVRQAVAGSALGLLGALGIARIIAASFPGMRIDSPTIFLGTTLLLVAIALLACWLPARRAGRIDATLALRAD
jgi:putative ABC transport system permease protein